MGNLFSRNSKENSLFESVALGDLRRVQTTLKSPVNVNAANSEGDTPLMIAAAQGNTELIQLLRFHGAHVDTQNLVGETALFKAIQSGSKAAVAMLLSMAADSSLLIQNHQSALHCAVRMGDLWMVQALVRHSSTWLNMKDHAGKTALYCAVENYQSRIVEALVDAGADVDEPDEEGITCLMLAVRDGIYDITRTLLRAGADRNATDDNGCVALRYTEDPVMRRILTGATVDVEAQGGWLLDHLTSLEMNQDDILLCTRILVCEQRLTSAALFAALPSSALRRHQLDSIGVSALGTQQILRNLHRSLKPAQISNGAVAADPGKAVGRKRPLYDINLTSSDEEEDDETAFSHTSVHIFGSTSDGASDVSGSGSDSDNDSDGSDRSSDSAGTGASDASDQEEHSDTASGTSTSTSTSTSSSRSANSSGHADLQRDISPITGAVAGTSASHFMPPPPPVPSMFPQRTPAVTTAHTERLLSPPHKRPRMDLLVQSAQSSRAGSGRSGSRGSAGGAGGAGAGVLNESFGDASADEEAVDSDNEGEGSEGDGSVVAAVREGESDDGTQESSQESSQGQGHREHTSKGGYFQQFLHQLAENPDLVYTADREVDETNRDTNSDGIDDDGSVDGADAGQGTPHSSCASHSCSSESPMVHPSRRRSQVVHSTSGMWDVPFTSTPHQYTSTQYEATQYVSDLYDITITDVTEATVDVLVDGEGEGSVDEDMVYTAVQGVTTYTQVQNSEGAGDEDEGGGEGEGCWIPGATGAHQEIESGFGDY